jgi:hypothetical protein
MAVNQDILKAIQTLDQRIANLQEIKRRLADEFGIVLSQESAPTELRQMMLPADQGEMGLVEKKSRKRSLEEFLRTHGPKTRQEIIEGTGFPEGTVSYCLNDKSIFVQLADGRWTLAAPETAIAS